MKKNIKILAIVTLIIFIIPLLVIDLLSSEPLDGGLSSDLNYAQVIYVEAVQSVDDSWCISTTVHHNDEGWDHYANAWQVLDEEDNEIAWRLLAHPHDDEQPFTRSKCDINIPPEVNKLRVRAKCKKHGFGGLEIIVDLSVVEGEKFKVTRKKQ
jgi:hypothetical protein